jgi:Uma2 family endonuclease
MSSQHQEQFDSPKPKRVKKIWSLEEYFDREYKVEGKHEFHNGEIRAMAYTSISHGDIFSNIFKQLANCIENANCKLYGSDRMVYIPFCNKVFYPDLVIVCGEHETKLHKKSMQATLNPKILIEVTSPSTEAEDRIDKWACYKTIPSLKQYLIVSHRKKAVEVYNRTQEENKWLNTEVTDEEDYVEIGDCKVKLKDIYNKVII